MSVPFKLIAHRGNFKGPNPARENAPDYIQEALQAGYYVEVDVRLINGELWTGHDEPQYRIKDIDLRHPRIYVHSKTIETLYYFLKHHPNIATFFHDRDEATLTSEGEIWTYPGKLLTRRSICVLPEWNNQIVPREIKGICSDYLEIDWTKTTLQK